MNFSTVFGVALRNLQRAPVRSSLTALGVIVGVAAVIATTSIGSGAQAKIQETLTRPESRTIYLGATLPRSQVHRLGAKLSPRDGLQPGDYYAVRQSVGNVSAISPQIYVSDARAQANGRSADIILEGIDLDGFTTVPRRLLDGSLFSGLDVQHAANVCVISESLARMLFPGGDAPNRHIRLNDSAFKVIGMVDDVDNIAPSLSKKIDLHAYIPFTSLLRRLDATALISVSAQARDIKHVNVVQQGIDDIMEQRRSGRKAEFRTINAFESLKTYADGSLAVARLLTAVGAISLVVGGIGIMNIMLVSVAERTREIGVRMAVGTRGKDILWQFLAEAVALSLLGGIAGIAIGWAASVTVTRLNEWPTAITLNSVLIAFLCSLTVGMFFGYHPARRAASVRPVDALRAEY